MYIDAASFDANDWELKESRMREGSLNGAPVSVLGEKNAIQSVRLNSGATEGFSLKNRKVVIEPMMHRISEISVEYKHTNSDGSSDSVKGDVKFNEDRWQEPDNSSSTNNENDTRSSDIDSSDRNQDQNTSDE